MKKLIFIALLFCFTQTKAQYVTISDSGFVAWLQVNVASAMHGNQMDTTDAAVTTLTSIGVNQNGVRDLTGIQYFDTLINLGCEGNRLTTLPKLPRTLQYLDCIQNQLTSIPNLPNSLVLLYCGANLLTSLPPLPNTLQQLWCSSNQITNLPNLPNSLIQLHCSNNQLTTLPTLPDSLEFLYCYNNHISCFPTFPNSILYNVPSPLSGPFVTFSIMPNPFTCLPNYILAMDSATLSYPLCAAGNVNGCSIVSNCIPSVNPILIQDTIPSTWDLRPNFSSNVTSATWYWGDGTSTQTLYPSHIYSAAGRYTICVTAYAPCGDSATFCLNSDTLYRLSNGTLGNMVYVNVLGNTTSIEQNQNKQVEVNIYPSPASNKITIDATNIVDVKLFDIVGNQITNTKQNQLDISNLQNGVYFVQVQTSTNSYTKKILVQY